MRDQTDEEYNERFLVEQKCLLLLDRLKHPNIIPLLGSYTYSGRHNFLFPHYEIDLWTFFHNDCRYKDFEKNATFFSALCGAASALCSTHKLYLQKEIHGLDIDAIGSYHDLRPSNVLISRDTFILADFGLGNIKSSDAASQTQWKLGGGDYSAPECMGDGFFQQDVGRAIGLWAFGCLMIEVIIYMELGAAKLQGFREKRMSETRFERSEDSSFHDKDGCLKSIVVEWLDSLTRSLLHPGPLRLLIQASKKALKTNPEDRPKIQEVYTELALISLRAHLIATRDHFHGYLKNSAPGTTGQTPNRMKLWLETERLSAFAYITGLDSDDVNSLSSDNLIKHYEKYVNIFKDMATSYPEGESKSVAVQAELMGGLDNRTRSQSDSLTEDLDNEICELVESMWNLLPTKERRKAEDVWLRTMLNTENVRRLEGIERTFKTEDDSLYEKGAAPAMMKNIRLSIKTNPTSMPEGFIVAETDVRRRLKNVRNHEFGLFRESTVLIEWMHYSTGWEKVRPDQRAMKMS